MAYMTYKEKEQLVKSGKSRIFNNWHEFAGVSMDDFLEGLLWLEEDPGDDQGRLTRELGCNNALNVSVCILKYWFQVAKRPFKHIHMSPDHNYRCN